ncbi:MAG: hypothetical protein IPF88_14385, partial [Candidatus Microthrix sp.]
MLVIPNVPHPDAPRRCLTATIRCSPAAVQRSTVAGEALKRAAPLGHRGHAGHLTPNGHQVERRHVQPASRPGATLSRALTQYGLDLNADAFIEVRPPSLVTSETLTATGQLPKFADDAYHMERDDLWAIPTGEVPLTSMHRDETLAEAALPIRYMTATPCYRREAGSAGRDTRGMLRSHEFDKVEILALTTPEQAPAMYDELFSPVLCDCRAGTDLADGRHLYRRPGPEPPSQHRHRGVCAGRRRLAGGVLGIVVLRLPGPS